LSNKLNNKAFGDVVVTTSSTSKNVYRPC